MLDSTVDMSLGVSFLDCFNFYTCKYLKDCTLECDIEISLIFPPLCELVGQWVLSHFFERCPVQVILALWSSCGVV
jgi:hypothetical protein